MAASSSGRVKPKPVVAELGRPETDEETAERLARQRRNYLGAKRLTNLVVALAASLLVVLVMVLVVTRPNPPEAPPIPVAQLAEQAGVGTDLEAIAPEVPEGWRANAAELRNAGDNIPYWYVGYVTPERGFVSLSQAEGANDTWLANQVRSASPTGTRTIGGIEWAEIDQRDAEDPGNLAYVLHTRQGDEYIVLYGTAEETEFTQFAEAVASALTHR